MQERKSEIIERRFILDFIRLGGEKSRKSCYMNVPGIDNLKSRVVPEKDKQKKGLVDDTFSISCTSKKNIALIASSQKNDRV